VKQGIIAKWCEVFYGLRKSTKKKELECFHKLHNELDKLLKDEITVLETNEQNFHTKQIGIKSMINSIYGICGTKFSPIANPDMAQTVTRQGRFCNQTTAKFILKRFMEKYGADKDYMVAVGGDTDSQFINLKCVSQWIAKKNGYPSDLLDWNDDQRRALWNEVYDFVENEVNPFVRKLVRDYCHTSQSNVLTYELEYMSDVGIYEGKKHYATHKIFDEGDHVDKIKWSGIELKKTQVPKEMKEFLQDIYEGAILKRWKDKDYKNYVNSLYDRFSKFTIDDISFWKGYNTERQSTGFLQMEVGTTGIAKACTYYN
jgi:DNA polymerase elongation subunit (family B)